MDDDEEERLELTLELLLLEEEELLDDVADAKLIETPCAKEAEEDIKDETLLLLDELDDDRLELILLEADEPLLLDEEED